MVKQSAPGAIIIHFLGGIHEIYFPYVLMNPLLLLAVIGGGQVVYSPLTYSEQALWQVLHLAASLLYLR